MQFSFAFFAIVGSAILLTDSGDAKSISDDLELEVLHDFFALLSKRENNLLGGILPPGPAKDGNDRPEKGASEANGGESDSLTKENSEQTAHDGGGPQGKDGGPIENEGGEVQQQTQAEETSEAQNKQNDGPESDKDVPPKNEDENQMSEPPKTENVDEQQQTQQEGTDEASKDQSERPAEGKDEEVDNGNTPNGESDAGQKVTPDFEKAADDAHTNEQEKPVPENKDDQNNVLDSESQTEGVKPESGNAEEDRKETLEDIFNKLQRRVEESTDELGKALKESDLIKSKEVTEKLTSFLENSSSLNQKLKGTLEMASAGIQSAKSDLEGIGKMITDSSESEKPEVSENGQHTQGEGQHIQGEGEAVAKPGNEQASGEQGDGGMKQSAEQSGNEEVGTEETNDEANNVKPDKEDIEADRRRKLQNKLELVRLLRKLKDDLKA